MIERTMKLQLGWVEALVALLLLAASWAGNYAVTKVNIAENTVRIDFLEQKSERTIEVLEKLDDSVDDLNVTMGKVEERLKKGG